jgi:hypothetical protein
MEPFNSILNLYKELGHKPDIFSFIPESGMQEAYVGRCLNCDMDLRYLYKLGEADCVRGIRVHINNWIVTYIYKDRIGNKLFMKDNLNELICPRMKAFV